MVLSIHIRELSYCHFMSTVNRFMAFALTPNRERSARPRLRPAAPEPAPELAEGPRFPELENFRPSPDATGIPAPPRRGLRRWDGNRGGNQLIAGSSPGAGRSFSATTTSSSVAELRTLPERIESASEMGACCCASMSRLSLTLWSFVASCRISFAGMDYEAFLGLCFKLGRPI